MNSKVGARRLAHLGGHLLLISSLLAAHAAAKEADAQDKSDQEIPKLQEYQAGPKTSPRRGWLLETAPGSEAASFLTREGEWSSLTPAQRAKATSLGSVAVTRLPSTALAEGLAHEDQFTRDHCMLLLEQQGDVAIPALGRALGSDSMDVRKRALTVLAKTPAPKLRSKIRSCLRCKDEHVRHEALRAYAALEPDDLLDRCERVLGWDNSPWVQHEAIHQLGKLGTLVSVDPLIQHLARTDEHGIRAYTFSWLRRLTGRSFDKNAEHWTAWWTNHREELLKAEQEEEETEEES